MQYVSEAVIALSEAPLKNADIPAVVDMASALHQRYPDFAASLGPTLGKVAAGPGAANKAGTGERAWQLSTFDYGAASNRHSQQCPWQRSKCSCGRRVR